MNREQAKDIVKHFDAIKAYADGSYIEYYDSDRDIWYVCEEPSFYGKYQYRAKNKKYRDLSITECFNLMINNITIYSGKYSYYIDWITKDGMIKLNFNSHIDCGTFTTRDLHRDFYYENGEPVAVELKD